MTSRRWRGVRFGRTRQAVIIAAALALPAAGAAAQGATPRGPSIEPGAIEALHRMGAHLRTLERFRVSADASRDEVLDDGQKVQISGTVSYIVHRPNRLRAEIKTDRKQRELTYDGKSLTVYAPRMRYYATVPAPPTIAALFDSADKRFGIDFPLADLFLWGSPGDGTDALTAARLIGPAFVNGVDADHYAFRQKDVDWQLWIARGDAPLPLRVVITTTSEPSQPQYSTTLTWDVTTPVDDSVFTFVPPPNSMRLSMAP